MSCGNYFIRLIGKYGVTINTLHDQEFIVITGLDTVLKIPDADLKQDDNGKYIIDITGHQQENCEGVFGECVGLPTSIEIPAELIEERSRQKRLHIFGKDMISTVWSYSHGVYFYFDNYRLQIVRGEKVAYADRIELIHGRKAVNVKALSMGHPYLELPEDIVLKFEAMLFQKAESEVSLVPVGKSLLNGKPYFKLSSDISPERFEWIKNEFEFFNGGDAFKGWLTCSPEVVSEKLGCSIKSTTHD